MWVGLSHSHIHLSTHALTITYPLLADPRGCDWEAVGEALEDRTLLQCIIRLYNPGEVVEEEEEAVLVLVYTQLVSMQYHYRRILLKSG